MSAAIQQKRDVSDYDVLNLKGLGDIFLTQSDIASLTLEGDVELLDHIKTEVNQGELVISYKNWLDFLLIPRSLKIYATMKDIHGVKVSGRGTLKADAIDTDQLKLNISGSGDIEIGHLTAENLEVATSGSGQFNISGKVNKQNVRVSGSGKYEAAGLDSQQAVVRVSGACRATLNAQEALDVSVSGSAEVRYAGSPRLRQRVSGSASIRHLDRI